jgi:hypothetical protein
MRRCHENESKHTRPRESNGFHANTQTTRANHMPVCVCVSQIPTLPATLLTTLNSGKCSNSRGQIERSKRIDMELQGHDRAETDESSAAAAPARQSICSVRATLAEDASRSSRSPAAGFAAIGAAARLARKALLAAPPAWRQRCCRSFSRSARIFSI